MITVELKSSLTGAVESMAFAAKLCYGKEQEHLTYIQQVELLKRVLESRHFSILEHANASFYITGVSRNFTHQLVRHRHMAFAQQSFHYTVAKDKQCPGLENPIAQELMEKSFNDSFKYYEELMALGVKKEDARHVLPSGITTRIVASAGIREWVQFVGIRSCAVNCDEIREVAMQVHTILNAELPFLRRYLGPTCFTEHVCHEGKKCCGKPWGTLHAL